MSGGAALALSIVLAVLLVAAFSKPARTRVSGLVYRDRQGRLVLVLTPATRKRRGRR
ncbi:hypothetical protein ACFQE5_23060 [Pseudonocardia hispaniensis]|uniref:Uncharacterized protein n=1 Tax=Pseudonocardia hispaniensis TaxID=904933 RepID=A0ABW1J8L2_9PSEU